MADLERLRAAYRDAAQGRETDHVAVDTWEFLASNDLGSKERARALEHILRCPQCAEIYRALFDLHADAVVFDPDAPAMPEAPFGIFTNRLKMWGGLGTFALAATVLLAVILPLSGPRGPTVNDPTQVVRSPQEYEHPVLLAPLNAELDWEQGANVVLSWTVVDPATPVVVEVFDAAGELIWNSPETMNNEIGWPVEVGKRPGRFYWRVISLSPEGGRRPSDLASIDFVGG